MNIDDKKIDELSHLARLSFEGANRDEIKKDLEKIIVFCEQLNAVDTEGVKPLIYMNENVNVVREDKADHSFTQKQALKNAPKADSDFFRVPKVIKTNRG